MEPVPTGGHVCFPTWGLCIMVLGEGNPSSLIPGTPRQTPQECKIWQKKKKKKNPKLLENSSAISWLCAAMTQRANRGGRVTQSGTQTYFHCISGCT